MLIGAFVHPEFLVITMLSILPSLYRETKTFAFHHQRALPTPFLNGHSRPPFKSWANEKPNSLWGREYCSVLELKHKTVSKKTGSSSTSCFYISSHKGIEMLFCFSGNFIHQPWLKKCVILNSDNLFVTVRCWNTLLEMFYIIWASCGESCDQFQLHL